MKFWPLTLIMRNSDIEVSQYGSLLMYKPGYDSRFIEETIIAHKLNGLMLFTDLMKDSPKDLSFLSKCSFLESLNLTTREDYDLGVLKDLPNLKRLTINTFGKTEIDLTHQTVLEDFAIEWRKDKVRGLEHCRRLENLCLIDYSEKDLNPIRSLHSLKDLRIKTGGIGTLDGIQELGELERLLLGNCQRLVTLHAINGLRSLKALEIESCRKVSDYEVLTDLPNLQFLRITNCGQIPSIKFTKNFPLLETLILNGNTKLTDGDVSPATGLKDYGSWSKLRP